MSKTTSRPGRPETVIPDDAPAKELAEYLRTLRRVLGSPSYRELGLLVYTAHNALSQTADGRFVGWASIVRYVDALRKYARREGKPDVVTDVVVANLRRLHERTSASRRREPSKTVAARRNRRVAELWAEHEHVQAAHSLRRQRQLPGGWPTPEVSDRLRLNPVDSVADLLAQLDTLVNESGVDVGRLRWGYHGAGRNSLVTLYRDGRPAGASPEWEMLTGRRPATIELVLNVVALCGGTAGDRYAWESVWQRVTTVPARPAPADLTATPVRHRQRQRHRRLVKVFDSAVLRSLSALSLPHSERAR
jgi:hypothetical protein